jgi:hypothetical protein
MRYGVTISYWLLEQLSSAALITGVWNYMQYLGLRLQLLDL